VCKLETLQEANLMTRKNDGASGIDRVTFAEIEQGGAEESAAHDECPAASWHGLETVE
jgi:hypothetical protein